MGVIEVNSISLFDSALCWWQRRRPLIWTQEQHLEHPTINCVDSAEHRLAENVARIVKESTE